MATYNALSNSQTLRTKISIVLPRLLGLSGAINRHPAVRTVYPDYLFILHCMIRASVPLMTAALRRCKDSCTADAVSLQLASYLETHIKEEAHHDDWLLDDLGAIDIRRADVLDRVPPPAVAKMVGAQYYWIRHHHPIALLGYIAVMEGSPPSSSAIDDIRLRTKLPRSLFRTLYKHADLDPKHKADLDALLDSLPLCSRQQELLGISAVTTVDSAADCFSDLLERHHAALQGTNVG